MGSIVMYVWRVRWPLMALITVLIAGLYYMGFTQPAVDRAVQSLTWALNKKVILIDPGHGGEDSGAKGRQGTLEKDINLQVAKKVANRLTEAGARVVLTRDTDENKVTGQWSQRAELSKRVELAKQENVAVYVAIHVNSFPSPKWSGHQVFYQPGSDEGKRLALHIQHEMTQRVGNKDNRQAKAEDYFVLRTSHCPSVMVEIGFLSNPGEEALLKREGHQEQLAMGIYAGIARYLAGEPAPESPPRSKGAASSEDNQT